MKKLTKTEKIRRAFKLDPNASVSDVAKATGATYQTVWNVKKVMATKAVADTKKDGLRRSPQGKILMQRGSPVIGKGNEYEHKDGKWQAVVAVTTDRPAKVDNVNHPAHYKVGGIETIDFIEAKGLSWGLNNVIKYVSRADHKGNRLEDLKKAQWYLDREIEKAKTA